MKIDEMNIDERLGGNDVSFEQEEELKTSKTSEKNIETGKIEELLYQLMPESYSLKRKRSILYFTAFLIFFIAFAIFVIR
jgi:hypothetical protein